MKLICFFLSFFSNRVHSLVNLNLVPVVTTVGPPPTSVDNVVPPSPPFSELDSENFF